MKWCRRRAAAGLKQGFIQLKKLAGSEFIGEADGLFRQLTRRREARFAVDMLEQLEADVANVQHALLQIAVAGCAELGAK